LGHFSIKIWTCKNREKKIKNHIFIHDMHGMDVEKYAKNEEQSVSKRVLVE